MEQREKQQSVNPKLDKDLKSAGELYEWPKVTRADQIAEAWAKTVKCILTPEPGMDP